MGISDDETQPWPLLISFLMRQSVSPNWRTRKGALAALRAIVVAAVAPRQLKLVEAEARDLKLDEAEARQLKLDEAEARLDKVDARLTPVAALAYRVLALDRFNDFAGDRVVAPVREQAAALLGAVLERASEVR